MFFGIASLILSAAATAFGITTQIASAQAAAETQRKNSEVQANSLKLQAEQEEQNQIQRSLVERRQNARKLAAAESQYAAAGVTMQGTPTIALARMSEEQELDTLMGEAASEQKRRILLTDAENVVNLGYANASLTSSSGLLSAVGTGLTGASSVARGAYELSSYEGKGKGRKNK